MMQRPGTAVILGAMWICPECRSIYDEPVPTCERDATPLAEVMAHQSRARYPLLGKIVGDRYHLIGGLGQGGLGTVYLAKHRHLNQLFAVKFLEVEAIVAPGADDEENLKEQYRKDFLREAQVASLIRHDSVVRVSDFGEHGRMPFLVMEYVPGPSLLSVLGREGRFELAEALAIARRIAEALDAFHERRLVHRDLKPANVILDPRGNGRLTLVDLGLVKDLSGPGGKASTHPLALRGTPGYLAPEQVPAWVLAGAGVKNPGEKQPVDARVDLYALGVILYEMLAGVSPYPEGNNTQVIVYTCTREPIPLSAVKPRVNLLPGLGELIADTMARDPERRPQTAADFLERLDRISMGLVQSGSWPAVMLPDRGRRETDESPAASAERRLLPSEAPAAARAAAEPSEAPAARVSANVLLAPPAGASPSVPDERSPPDLSLPGDDEEEETVVYGDVEAPVSRPGDATALVPAVERGDDEATMEADLADSMDGLYDGSPDSLPPSSASVTQESPAMIAATRTAPPARAPEAPSRAPWIAAAAILAAAAAVVWWLTQRPEEAAPVRIAVGADAAPPVVAVPSAPDEALLPADAIAGPRDFVAPREAGDAIGEPPSGGRPAPASVPAAPRSVATADKPSPSSALAGRPAAPSAPRPPPRASADALLDRARRAYESMDAPQALELYRQAFAQLPADHPEYFTVQQRIEALAKRVGPK